MKTSCWAVQNRKNLIKKLVYPYMIISSTCSRTFSEKIGKFWQFFRWGKEGYFWVSRWVSRWYLMEKLAINGKIKQFVYI